MDDSECLVGKDLEGGCRELLLDIKTVTVLQKLLLKFI
jgi:hypothetical protein